MSRAVRRNALLPLLLSLAATVSALVTCSGRVRAAPAKPLAHYTATAVNMDPSVAATAAYVDITVTRWSTDDEASNLLGAIADQKPSRVADLLRGMPSTGTIKTPDSMPYDLRFARRTVLSTGSERIVLVTDRSVSYFEIHQGTPSLDYPFTAISLQLDAQGKGTGQLLVAARLAADPETHDLTIQNYGESPIHLTSVKRDK